MADNELKFTRRAKIFFSLALAAFLLGNAIALFIYYVFVTETPSYTAESIQNNPIASLAYLGTMMTQVVGCTVTAGLGNVLSIFFPLSLSPFHRKPPMPAVIPLRAGMQITSRCFP
jgi:hypothetical protein